MLGWSHARTGGRSCSDGVRFLVGWSHAQTEWGVAGWNRVEPCSPGGAMLGRVEPCSDGGSRVESLLGRSSVPRHGELETVFLWWIHLGSFTTVCPTGGSVVIPVGIVV